MMPLPSRETLRIIARLDVRGGNLIKGIHLEGVRRVGDPGDFARRYYDQGIDEILFMDVVATLYGRNTLRDILTRATQDVFVPITVGGGVRSVGDFSDLLRAGADKVAVNTAALQDPSLIGRLAAEFGVQSVVISIEAKECSPGRWEALTNNGREPTGVDVLEWAQEAVDLGAGELLVTSIDREGTRKGFDKDLIKAVCRVVTVPVIASGGLGESSDLVELAICSEVSAIAVADALHFGRLSVKDLRSDALSVGLPVRPRV
jgi:cyclase